MQTLFFRALWGMTEGRNLEEKCAIAREAGYDGIEAAVDSFDPVELRETTSRHGLRLIAQVFPLTPSELRSALAKAREAGAMKAVSHSGRDRWPLAEGIAFLREALAIEREFGIPVGHETHRYRLFYAPWATAELLRAVPELRVTLDLSHWCVVCESLLDDMEDFTSLAIERAVHVHARVGHEEGPQVSDPSAPEYRRHLERHAQWWNAVRARHLAEGAAMMTVTPEFGPPGYMQTIPHTGQPVADNWTVNLWMRDWLKGRWGC